MWRTSCRTSQGRRTRLTGIRRLTCDLRINAKDGFSRLFEWGLRSFRACEVQEHELNAFSATTTSFNWAKVEAQDRVYAERLFREK